MYVFVHVYAIYVKSSLHAVLLLLLLCPNQQNNTIVAREGTTQGRERKDDGIPYKSLGIVLVLLATTQEARLKRFDIVAFAPLLCLPVSQRAYDDTSECRLFSFLLLHVFLLLPTSHWRFLLRAHKGRA